ncbi:MAG TPA: RsmD family RNA methyltransferase, partial [Elusimicrobiales bacterium]|nr:RsmD family RNA methyltransferase [Elusimicrobiales bacterium]
YVTGSVFLDLYAGVGTVGLEALSRGAATVIFVEKAGICVKTIEKNMDNLGVRDRARVLKADVMSGLKWLEHFSDYKGYDIVFLSPPYRDGANLPLSYTSRTLALAAGDGIAAPGCLFIAQHHKNERIEVPAALNRFRQEKYGDTLVDFFRIA